MWFHPVRSFDHFFHWTLVMNGKDGMLQYNVLPIKVQIMRVTSVACLEHYTIVV